MDITLLFVLIDDFCKIYDMWEAQGFLLASKRRKRCGYLSLSEKLLIEIYYHFSGFRNFKEVPSYERFMHLRQGLNIPLLILIHCLKDQKTGHYYIDSTALKDCHNKRIFRHKTLKGIAKRSQTSMGWFFGLKLHLVINDQGKVMSLKITSEDVDDRKPVREMMEGFSGKLFGDRGYIDKALFKYLWRKSVHLITGICRNMKNYLMPWVDKKLLRKRGKIETIFGLLKDHMDLEHTRHRSKKAYLINILSSVAAYALKNFSYLYLHSYLQNTPPTQTQNNQKITPNIITA